MRSALLAGGNPRDGSQRALAHIKSNLGPLAEPIGYAVEEGQFKWTGATGLTVRELLAQMTASLPAIDEAVEFLRDMLADGPKPVTEILTAAKEAGLSDKRLRSARERICRKPQRVGGLGEQGYWVWELKGSA